MQVCSEEGGVRGCSSRSASVGATGADKRVNTPSAAAAPSLVLWPPRLHTDAWSAHGGSGLCPPLGSQVKGQVSHLGEAKKGDSGVYLWGKERSILGVRVYTEGAERQGRESRQPEHGV